MSLTIGTGAGRAGNVQPEGLVPFVPPIFISLHVPATISPSTSPSSSELLARRFAPCRPVLATSPAA